MLYTGFKLNLRCICIHVENTGKKAGCHACAW